MDLPAVDEPEVPGEPRSSKTEPDGLRGERHPFSGVHHLDRGGQAQLRLRSLLPGEHRDGMDRPHPVRAGDVRQGMDLELFLPCFGRGPGDPGSPSSLEDLSLPSRGEPPVVPDGADLPVEEGRELLLPSHFHGRRAGYAEKKGGLFPPERVEILPVFVDHFSPLRAARGVDRRPHPGPGRGLDGLEVRFLPPHDLLHAPTGLPQGLPGGGEFPFVLLPITLNREG